MLSFYLYVRKLFCALVQKYLPHFWITIFLSKLINVFVLFSGTYFCGEEAWQFEVYFFQIIFNIKKKKKTLSRCLKTPEVKYSFWPCLKNRYLFINHAASLASLLWPFLLPQVLNLCEPVISSAQPQIPQFLWLSRHNILTHAVLPLRALFLILLLNSMWPALTILNPWTPQRNTSFL